MALCRDYPHICGEYKVKTKKFLLYKGLSPRLWGILASGCGKEVRPWVIPMCVGNKFLKFLEPILFRGYPHICGEHLRRTSARDGSERLILAPARNIKERRDYSDSAFFTSFLIIVAPCSLIKARRSCCRSLTSFPCSSIINNRFLKFLAGSRRTNLR